MFVLKHLEGTTYFVGLLICCKTILKIMVFGINRLQKRINIAIFCLYSAPRALYEIQMACYL
jgi:hypothetical protein